jgi:hypothetical protein
MGFGLGDLHDPAAALAGRNARVAQIRYEPPFILIETFAGSRWQKEL